MQYKLRGLVWMIALRKWRPTVRHQKTFRNSRAFREQQWHVLEEASSYRVTNVWKHGVWWGKQSMESHTLICSIRQAYWNPLFPTSRSSAWLQSPPHNHCSPVTTSQPSPSYGLPHRWRLPVIPLQTLLSYSHRVITFPGLHQSCHPLIFHHSHHLLWLHHHSPVITSPPCPSCVCITQPPCSYNVQRSVHHTGYITQPLST